MRVKVGVVYGCSGFLFSINHWGKTWKEPAEGSEGGSVRPLGAQLFSLTSGGRHPWRVTSIIYSNGNSCTLSGYPQRLHRTPLSALIGLLPLYIAIIVGAKLGPQRRTELPISLSGNLHSTDTGGRQGKGTIFWPISVPQRA